MDRREALAALAALPGVARIAVARAKPTDVIVIESDRDLSQEAIQNITQGCRQVFGDEQRVIVLDRHLTLKVLEQRT